MSGRSSLIFSPGASGPALRLADWRDDAACGSQMDLFFGPDGETTSERGRRERKAKAVCAACPVQAPCGNLSRAVGAEHGVWAGMGEDDRSRSYAGGRSHKSRADRERLAAIREAGERTCTGPCGQVKPLGAFPRHGGRCKDCLADQLRESNRQRREAREAQERAA